MEKFTCKDCIHFDKDFIGCAQCSNKPSCHNDMQHRGKCAENNFCVDSDNDICLRFESAKGEYPRFYHLSKDIDAMADALIQPCTNDMWFAFTKPYKVFKNKNEAIAAVKEWLMEPIKENDERE